MGSHRLLHIKPLYKYIHCLHHRNVDIEPFSGMCMHWVEHMYYFSCALFPSLYIAGLSPFHFLFNGVHLLLSPAASHSGWEDHWQSDQFHYLHHARFECNYGSASLPLDHLCGTFRETLAGTSKTYKGGANNVVVDGKKLKAANQNHKQAHKISLNIKAAQGFTSYYYMSLSLIIYVIFICFRALYINNEECAMPSTQQYFPTYIVPFVGSFGFIILAFMIETWVGLQRKGSNSLRWPFHKEAMRKFGLHVFIGLGCAVVPIYH